MTKAKAKARAKARAMAKLANRKPKGEDTPEASDGPEAKEKRSGYVDAREGGMRNTASHIKSAARTTRGAARSR